MAGKIKFLLEEEVQREGTTGGGSGRTGGGGGRTGYICDRVKVQQQSAIKSGSVSVTVVMC